MDVTAAFEGAPFSKTLGIRVESAGSGRAVLSMEVRAAHAQVFGVTHGGVVATLLDSAAAAACRASLPDGTNFTSAEFTVHLLRPAPLGRLVAEAAILHLGSRRIVAEATARDAEGHACARYTGSFLVIEPRGGPATPSAPGT